MADNDEKLELPHLDYDGKQYFLALPEFAPPSVDGDVLSSLQKITNRYLVEKKKHRDFIYAVLKNWGYPVFEVHPTNDTVSVESDFGAPGIAIPFAAQIFDFNRAARYVPVSNNVSTYFTHTDKAFDIIEALEDEGFLIFRDLEPDLKRNQIHFANGGVTRCFADTIDAIIKTHRSYQPLLNEIEIQYNTPKLSQSGAIILPVPTYGLFHSQLKDAVKGQGVQILTVRRNDDGSVNEASLKNTLKYCYDHNIRVLAYYDCNPNNPTGYIRDEEKTKRDAAILMEANSRECKRHEAFFEKLLEDEGVSKGVRSAVFAAAMFLCGDGSSGSIRILDDMAYQGLEIDNKKKPFSFGQVSGEVADLTVVLKSMSKIGMPGLRVGLMIGLDSLVSGMADRQLMREFTANNFGVDMLWARFGASSAYKDLFRQHKTNLKRHLLKSMREFEALFYGIENVEDMSDFAKRSFIRRYSEYAGISDEDSYERLKIGLPNFHLLPRPEAGFFRRVNFDSLIGRTMAVHFKDEDYPDQMAIGSSYNLYWAMKAFKIDQIPGGSQGLTFASFSPRFSITMPNKDDIFVLYDRLKEMHDYFFGLEPETQLDLMRSNPAVGYKPF